MKIPGSASGFWTGAARTNSAARGWVGRAIARKLARSGRKPRPAGAGGGRDGGRAGCGGGRASRGQFGGKSDTAPEEQRHAGRRAARAGSARARAARKLRRSAIKYNMYYLVARSARDNKRVMLCLIAEKERRPAPRETRSGCRAIASDGGRSEA